MEKIGIYGGAFDPIHLGHLITAQIVLEKRKLDRIIFIPCHLSPHKNKIISTEPMHRLEMIKLAIKDTPYFSYSDFEINRGEVSYSLKTIVEFKKQYENIELIIGYDNLIDFDKWYKPYEIIQLCKLIVLKRTIDNAPIDKHKYFQKAIYIDTPIIDLSSSEIRQRVNSGLPIKFMVPATVDDYIGTNLIYKEKKREG